MKTTTEPLFSNGTEMMIWQDRNCVRCINASHLNEKTGDYTAFRCSIDRDIQAQSAGLDEVNVKSYEAVRQAECQYMQTERKTPKRRKIKGQTELNF